MTERRSTSLLGPGLIYALATVAPVLVALLVTPLVTRLLGAAAYGIVGVSISVYQTTSIVVGLGLSAAITRHAIIEASGIRGAVAQVYFGAAMSGLLVIFSGALLPFWGHWVLPTGDPYVLIFPLLSAFGLAILTFSQSVLRAQERVKTFVALAVASAMVGPAIGLMLVLLVEHSSAFYLLGLAVGHLLAATASLLLLPRVQRADFHRDDLKSGLRIGLPTVPHSVAAALLATIVVVLVSHFDGLTSAGRTQLALFLGTAPLMILAAFNNSWAPMVYRTNDQERPRLLERSAEAISVLVFALVGGFCVFVDPVARFIAGPELYSQDLTRTALIAAASTPFMALYLVNINEVFRSGKTTLLAITTPASAASALGLASLAASASGYIIAISAAIPAFHLFMWLSSVMLRKRTGALAPRMRSAYAGFALAFSAAIGCALTAPPSWIALIVFLAVAVSLGVAHRAVLRSFL